MKISIKRKDGFVDFEVDAVEVTLLEVLEEIKTTIDSSLSYSSGCRSSVCGSCAVRVNGKEVLACSYKVEDNDKVESLNNLPIIRDLVVDMDKSYETISRAKAHLQEFNKDIKLTSEDEKINELQSDCILCGSCYSACPVYSVNKDFLGPFALTRVWKYVSDKREGNEKDKIDTIQTNGVWDCTLCNECTLVCPQTISSKSDIEKLRTKSIQNGYSDPSFASGFGFFDDGLGF